MKVKSKKKKKLHGSQFGTLNSKTITSHNQHCFKISDARVAPTSEVRACAQLLLLAVGNNNVGVDTFSNGKMSVMFRENRCLKTEL
jgi:hypothetical protein